MKAALLLLIIALAGCSESPVAREERKLAMMEKAGASLADICAQSKAVTAAYLESGDEATYRSKKMFSDQDCLNAEIHERFIRNQP